MSPGGRRNVARVLRLGHPCWRGCLAGPIFIRGSGLRRLDTARWASLSVAANGVSFWERTQASARNCINHQ